MTNFKEHSANVNNVEKRNLHNNSFVFHFEIKDDDLERILEFLKLVATYYEKRNATKWNNETIAIVIKTSYFFLFILGNKK